jgi:hypothetical protein
MKRHLVVTAAAVFLGVCAFAAQPKVPVAPQIINFSLLEALVAVNASNLAGVFGFIPEDHASMAMADYLVHDQKALKLFIKKCEKDLKVAKGINEWDKQVCAYIVGINASGTLPPEVKPIPPKLMSHVNELLLVDALPLQVVVQRRAGR